MGEYAEMMLDGTCCAGCGEYLDGAGIDGVPSYCASCQPDWASEYGGAPLDWFDAPMVPCPCCRKQFGNERAMSQHRAAKHPPKTHVCADCSKAFASDQALSDHRKAKHETP